MYYLLGFRMFGEEQEAIENLLSGDGADDGTSVAPNTQRRYGQRKTSWLDSVWKSASQQHYGKSQIFLAMDEAVVQQVQ